jgi:phosphatidylserine synthase 2
MKTCEWLRVSPFSWRGLRPVVSDGSSTSRRKAAKYAAQQFTPHDWTEFRWEGTKRFRKSVESCPVPLASLFLSFPVIRSDALNSVFFFFSYISTVALLTVFLLSELNVFYVRPCSFFSRYPSAC